MKLKKLKIEGLFDRFNYDILLDNEEGVTIITGPNGYGKTKILNIINSFFNEKFDYFQKLIFKRIEMHFEDNIIIIIEKKLKKQQDYTEIHFNLYKNNELVEVHTHDSNKNEEIVKDKLREQTPLYEMEEDIWIDHRTEEMMTFAEAIRYLPKHEFNKYSKYIKKEFPLLEELISKTTTHLIQEQRLIEKDFSKLSNRNARLHRQIQEDDVVYTIHRYAETLKDLIYENLQKNFVITQDLDSTFPKRLLTEKDKIREEECNNRFDTLRKKQEKLRKFGVSDVAQEVAPFDNENAKVLLVYLNDAEQKLNVFDELIEKLELFTNILNERRFSYKSIKIDKEKGFSFFTEKGKKLELTDLSSGEQNEVVLLYELIFNSKPNTLILIDEPEISLHVAWQREFLSDLLKIVELQKINVVIATHSPSIINNYGELSYDLYLAQQKEELIEL
jgi:predicted ATP-binding protein involved in virulence